MQRRVDGLPGLSKWPVRCASKLVTDRKSSPQPEQWQRPERVIVDIRGLEILVLKECATGKSAALPRVGERNGQPSEVGAASVVDRGRYLRFLRVFTQVPDYSLTRGKHAKNGMHRIGEDNRAARIRDS